MNNELKIGGIYVLNIKSEKISGYFLFETSDFIQLNAGFLKNHSKFMILAKTFNHIKVLSDEGYLGWTVIENKDIGDIVEHEQ